MKNEMNTNNTQISYEQMASELENSENYKVIKKYTKIDSYHVDDIVEKQIGIFLDVETTGLDPQNDKIIELALVPFEFSKDGRIFQVLESYSSLQDPHVPITEKTTLLTGITNEMVRECSIDLEKITEIVNSAHLIVAHNARFDRQFVEQQFPIFQNKSWACSQNEIPWFNEGINSSKLEYLAYKFGFFYDAHRAEIDCLGGIHLLSQILPISKQLALKSLLEKSGMASYRIWAENAPYDMKDILKSRGYYWSNGSNSKPKSWFIEVYEDKKEVELNFLYEEIYKSKSKPNLRIEEFNSLNRFSART